MLALLLSGERTIIVLDPFLKKNIQRGTIICIRFVTLLGGSKFFPDANRDWW